RPPAAAAIGGRVPAPVQPLDFAQAFAVIVVLEPHACDRMRDGGARTHPHYRKQNRLLFLHVGFELLGQESERSSEADRRLWMADVDALDLLGEANELRQFAPMGLVVASENMIDQFRWFARVFLRRRLIESL